MSEIQIQGVKFAAGMSCPKCARPFDRSAVRETTDAIELDCPGCHHVAATIELNVEPGDELWD